MPKNLQKTLGIISSCFLISASVFGAGIWLTMPRAEKFVIKVYEKEQMEICKKLDSLIIVTENHRMQTQKKLDRVNFLLLEAVPQKKRLQILRKYKAFCEQE